MRSGPASAPQYHRLPSPSLARNSPRLPQRRSTTGCPRPASLETALRLPQRRSTTGCPRPTSARDRPDNPENGNAPMHQVATQSRPLWRRPNAAASASTAAPILTPPSICAATLPLATISRNATPALSQAVLTRSRAASMSCDREDRAPLCGPATGPYRPAPIRRRRCPARQRKPRR